MVEPDEHAVRVALGETARELGVLEARRADDDTPDAHPEQRVGGLDRAHSPAALHLDRDLADDLAHDLAVDGVARARRVEVDDVEEGRAAPGVGERTLDGIAVGGLLGELAAHEPHGLSAADVDRRDALHRHRPG